MCLDCSDCQDEKTLTPKTERFPAVFSTQSKPWKTGGRCWDKNNSNMNSDSNLIAFRFLGVCIWIFWCNRITCCRPLALLNKFCTFTQQLSLLMRERVPISPSRVGLIKSLDSGLRVSDAGFWFFPYMRYKYKGLQIVKGHWFCRFAAGSLFCGFISR